MAAALRVVVAAAAAVLLLLLSLTSMVAAQTGWQPEACQNLDKCSDCTGVCEHSSTKDCNDCRIKRGACADLCGVSDVASCKTRCQVIFDGCEASCATIEQFGSEGCHTDCVTTKTTCDSADACISSAN